MKKSTYADDLLDPRWQKKRLQIMERDEFTCMGCGVTNVTLHVHHTYYVSSRKPWEYPDWSLTTLCKDCHEKCRGKKAKEPTWFEFLMGAGRFEEGAIPCLMGAYSDWLSRCGLHPFEAQSALELALQDPVISAQITATYEAHIKRRLLTHAYQNNQA